MSNHGLFDEFPETSAKEWKQKIQFQLDGANYNDTLVWESPEGIKVKPFYTREDLSKLPQTTEPKEWNLAQTVFVKDSTAANTKAKYLLQNGVESLSFVITDVHTDIATLLEGIPLDNCSLFFNFRVLSQSLITQIINHTKDKQTFVFLQIDVIGHLARTGNWFINEEEDFSILKETIKECELYNNISVLGVYGDLYQNAGANLIQQLAYSLAHANEYLNYAEQHNVVNPKPIVISISIGGNYFFEIAKIKAFKLLWRTVLAEYPWTVDCHIYAHPTKRNKTLYDYHNNIVRATTECMSAILGEANTINNLPFDFFFHKENDFSERIARNQLLLLKHESELNTSHAAADGTYYIASLTQQLAQQGLNLFKNIESKGGFLSMLKKGDIQKKIWDSAKKEQTQLEENAVVLVGTNTYPNKNEKANTALEINPFSKTNPRKTSIIPIIEKRLSEKLEQKRLKDEE